jgi:hypothetical protein
MSNRTPGHNSILKSYKVFHQSNINYVIFKHAAVSLEEFQDYVLDEAQLFVIIRQVSMVTPLALY